MENYYFVIYFRDGSKYESGPFCGVGAETSCERAAQMEFDRQAQVFADQPQFAPTRWDVKCKQQ